MTRKRRPTKFQLGRGNMFPDGGGMDGSDVDNGNDQWVFPTIQQTMKNNPVNEFAAKSQKDLNDFMDDEYWHKVSAFPDEYRDFDLNDINWNTLLSVKPRSKTHTGLPYGSLPEVEVIPSFYGIYNKEGFDFEDQLTDMVVDESINPSISLANPYYITTNEKGIWPNGVIKDNNSIVNDDFLEKVYNASKEAGVDFYQGLALTMKERNGLTQFVTDPTELEWYQQHGKVSPKWQQYNAVPNYMLVNYWRGAVSDKVNPYYAEWNAVGKKFRGTDSFEAWREENKLLRQAYKSTKKKAEKELAKARINLLTRAFDDAWHKKNYNPGQKDYNQQLQQHVKALMTSPEIKAWLDWKEGRTKERDTSKLRYVKRAYGGKLRKRLSI